jgi:hypothetical protein
MKNPWVVLEIYKDVVRNAIGCEDYDDAVEVFSSIVAEYGVEPYEEMINENIFREDDGFTVQMLELK